MPVNRNFNQFNVIQKEVIYKIGYLWIIIACCLLNGISNVNFGHARPRKPQCSCEGQNTDTMILYERIEN